MSSAPALPALVAVSGRGVGRVEGDSVDKK